MRSFDWVLSPRGPDGRPEPMFDHETGAVDPAVVAYWRERYDIAARPWRDWPALEPELDGKIRTRVPRIVADQQLLRFTNHYKIVLLRRRQGV